MAPRTETLKGADARKTYRYLRIGMIGVVVLLAVSIAIERSKVDCFQTSISAYYYTPVRAVFVGFMIAVGLSLIVYKGRSPWEDLCLNFAGMLAPVVAVAPTIDVGACWSIDPQPRPRMDDGVLATWVVKSIDNNIRALLLVAAIGLLTAFVIAVVVKKKITAPMDWEHGMTFSLVATGALLLGVWWLIENWDDFNTRAHGFAAVGMVGFLILALLLKVLDHRDELDKRWFWIYAAIAFLMLAGAVVIPLTRIFHDHTTFALETYEIVFFALFWTFQTAENWNEPVEASTTS